MKKLITFSLVSLFALSSQAGSVFFCEPAGDSELHEAGVSAYVHRGSESSPSEVLAMSIGGVHAGACIVEAVDGYTHACFVDMNPMGEEETIRSFRAEFVPAEEGGNSVVRTDVVGEFSCVD